VLSASKALSSRKRVEPRSLGIVDNEAAVAVQAQKAKVHLRLCHVARSCTFQPHKRLCRIL